MKNILNIVLLLCVLNSFAQIIEVKQDGTGDFTIIQEAMDFAQQGDTVLVWPGTYFENLDFNGKSLTLASLMLTTEDEDYKFSTLIDGGGNGRCVNISSFEENAIVYGFTIINGKAEDGGGIRTYESNAQIINNIIKNNHSFKYGAGVICSYDSYTVLTGNSIFDNHAYYSGGGIAIVGSSVEFDSISRNSIYNNFAERGCDIIKTVSSEISTIFLDTCSVLVPDSYFIISIDESGNQLNNLEIDILNSTISPHDGDIYVNPLTGDNINSGTSFDEPLKSIAWAYHKIHVDSLNKNTIRLANGIYSDTTNNEKFPLNIRPFINVIGQSRDGVILDGNRKVYIFKGNNNITDYSLQRMTLQGGAIPTYETWEIRKLLMYLYSRNKRFLIDSIIFKDSYAKGALAILTYWSADSSMVKNCEFRDNIGGHALRTVIGSGKVQFINNTKFINQQVDPNYVGNSGWALSTGSQGIDIIQNCLFQDNMFTAFIKLYYGGDAYLINCTFDNNSSMEDKPVVFAVDANIHIYNSIYYNNYDTPLKVSVGEYQQQVVSNLNIFNSLIEGGELSIEVGSSCFHSNSTWCFVHYDSTNIDNDPNFLGMWGDPYMITDGSPCIDAGTLANLPDFIEIPEFDLAGNPRIVGDSIDMGAYEWNPTIVGFNEIGPGNRQEKPKLLKASPNPFDWGTYIEVYAYAKASADKEVKVEIYNNYGILVGNILTTTLSQDTEILWYGDDNNGNPLPAGIYHVVMFYGEREVESLKVVKK